MQQALLLLPVLLPALFWAVYHYRQDRHLPEPLPNLLAAFALGAVAAGTSHFLYSLLEVFGLRYDALLLADTSTIGLLLYAVLAIGPIEEFAKLLPFILVVVHFRSFDEPIDGIIYASFIGLGYAAVENLHYLQYLTPLESYARGFAGPVVHILFASIWAYAIGRARLANRSIVIAAIVGFGFAALLHGIYDFFVLLQPVAALPAAAAMIVTIWIWRLFVLRKMRRDARTAGQ